MSSRTWCPGSHWSGDGLIVLVHPNAGDDLLDHRDRALWLGAGLDLKLGMFERDG